MRSLEMVSNTRNTKDIQMSHFTSLGQVWTLKIWVDRAVEDRLWDLFMEKVRISNTWCVSTSNEEDFLGSNSIRFIETGCDRKPKMKG